MAVIPKNIETDNENEVAILIDNERFRFWKKSDINLSMDSIDSFSFSGPWQPEVERYRNIFQPLSFKPVAVYVGGEIIINALMITVKPSVKSNSRIFSVGGYSLPGIMNDCNFPHDAYPIEFNSFGLVEIAVASAAYFDIDVQFDAEAGDIFERVAAKPSEKVLSFLIKLAKQRNLLVTNTLEGKLLFTQATSAKSNIFLKEGETPLLEVDPSYNAQNYFSSITGLSPNQIAKFSESFIVNNSFLPGNDRPFVFEVSDAISADLQRAVNSKAGRMFADAISVNVTCQGWRDPNGDLWQPNKIIKLQSDGAMIYNETEFLIKRVKLTREKSDQAVLQLILPESFQGKIPDTLPWL